MSSYLSKLIPLARARSSSPIVLNSLILSPTPLGISGAGAAASHRARSHHHISSLTAALSSHSDPRGYTTVAFAAGADDGLLFGLERLGGEGRSANAKPKPKKKQPSLARSMSDVAVPDPPTSNHLHKPIPGATGKLFYTET